MSLFHLTAFIALEFFEHLLQCQKTKKTNMDIRITCSNLTAGMFQTGVFEAFHNVARVSNMFEAPDPSDQSDHFFWCCRPNRILKSVHSNLFFVFRVGFSCVCVQKPHNLVHRNNCRGLLLDSPSLLKPSSITLAVSRRGQGRWLGVQRLGVYTGGVLPHALKHRVREADRGFN